MKKIFSLFPFLIGLIVAIMLMNLWLHDWNNQGNQAQDFALGLQNTAYFAQDGDYNFHCSDFIERPLDNCFQDYLNYSYPDPLILYLGNSQLHGINQPELGLNSSSKILYEHLKTRNDITLLTLSMPNMSLQEQLAAFEYSSSKLPLKTLILSVSFDNTRESGIRDGLLDLFSDPKTISELKSSKTGLKLIANHGDKDGAGNDLAALRETQQEAAEKYLNSSLGSIWESWDKRGGLRSYLIINLYQFRNYVFGINSSSTRKKIPARYEENLNALDDILKRTKEKGINTLVYSVPLRKDVKIPYEPKEYSDFLKDTKKITQDNEGVFYNLEDLVPPKFWGTVDGINATGGKEEIDFMHFQGGGHELLGSELIKIINIENLDI